MKACWAAAPGGRPTFEELAAVDLGALCTSMQALHQLHLAVWRRCK
jgi:hypothetical protein